MLKKLNLIAFASFFINPFAFAGGMDSGGGNGAFNRNGQLEIVDFLDNPQSIVPVDLIAIKNQFYSKDRYTKVLGKVDKNFFNCAFEKAATEPVLIKAFQKVQWTLVRVRFVNFRLVHEAKSTLQKDFPYSTAPSPSIDAKMQVPISVYMNDDLWVSAQFYKKLSTQSQCALSFHEALRVLNGQYIFHSNLTTQEIESLTRFYFKQTKDQFTDTALKKLEQFSGVDGRDSYELKELGARMTVRFNEAKAKNEQGILNDDEYMKELKMIHRILLTEKVRIENNVHQLMMWRHHNILGRVNLIEEYAAKQPLGPVLLSYDDMVIPKDSPWVVDIFTGEPVRWSSIKK